MFTELQKCANGDGCDPGERPVDDRVTLSTYTQFGTVFAAVASTLAKFLRTMEGLSPIGVSGES
jgi:hypothetical protein